MKVPEIFEKIWAWIKAKFEALNKELLPIADVAVDVTNALKTLMDSGAVDVITSITPTKVDDRIAAAIRNALPKVLSTMSIIQDVASSDITPDQAAVILLDRVKQLVPDSQAFQWLEFSSKLTKELAKDLEDDDLSITEAINLAHEIYNAIKK